MNIYSKNKKFKKFKYAKEADFEADVVSHSDVFFGERTIFIDAKKKIDSKSRRVKKYKRTKSSLAIRI